MQRAAGLTYGDGPVVERYKAAKLHGWYFADKDEAVGKAINRLSTVPLHRHRGRVVAIRIRHRRTQLSSGSCPECRSIGSLRSVSFRPLRRVNPGFFLPLEKSARLANVDGWESGRLNFSGTAGERSDYVYGRRKCFSGGAGLAFNGSGLCPPCCSRSCTEENSTGAAGRPKRRRASYA